MANLLLREWTETPPHASQVYFSTKMIDFDNPYSKKTITGIVLNVTEELTTAPSWVFNIHYRDKLNMDYVFITSISYHPNSSTETKEQRVFKSLHIPNVYHFQLYVEFFGHGSNIGLNDMNVLYREHRPVSTDRFSGE